MNTIIASFYTGTGKRTECPAIIAKAFYAPSQAPLEPDGALNSQARDLAIAYE